MPSDGQDKAGVVAPPPVIYLAALVFGLLLNRRFPSGFLPRKIDEDEDDPVAHPRIWRISVPPSWPRMG